MLSGCCSLSVAFLLPCCVYCSLSLSLSPSLYPSLAPPVEGRRRTSPEGGIRRGGGGGATSPEPWPIYTYISICIYAHICPPAPLGASKVRKVRHICPGSQWPPPGCVLGSEEAKPKQGDPLLGPPPQAVSRASRIWIPPKTSDRCMHMHTYAYMWAHAHICIHMRTYAYICTHVCICTHGHMQAHACICMHMQAHASICIHVHNCLAGWDCWDCWECLTG